MEEALNVCVVPPETIAKGPLVENVCVAPVSPLREEMAVAGRQVLPTAKHPAVMLMPPEPWKVEVAALKFAMPWRESRVPGLVVPMPTFPVSDILIASARMPDRKVEKMRSPFPVP